MQLEQLIELQKEMWQVKCELNHNCLFCEHFDFCRSYKDFYYKLKREIEERQKYNN